MLQEHLPLPFLVISVALTTKIATGPCLLPIHPSYPTPLCWKSVTAIRYKFVVELLNWGRALYRLMPLYMNISGEAIFKARNQESKIIIKKNKKLFYKSSILLFEKCSKPSCKSVVSFRCCSHCLDRAKQPTTTTNKKKYNRSVLRGMITELKGSSSSFSEIHACTRPLSADL